MSKISIELTNQDIVLQLQGIAAQFDDLSAPMAEIAELFQSETEDALADERSPVDNSPWPALSENYLKANPKRRGGQMLQASAGGLAASIEADSGDFWAMIGSNKPYAAIHNFGGLPEFAPGPAAIPQREYLGISKNDESEVLDILENHFSQAL